MRSRLPHQNWSEWTRPVQDPRKHCGSVAFHSTRLPTYCWGMFKVGFLSFLDVLSSSGVQREAREEISEAGADSHGCSSSPIPLAYHISPIKSEIRRETKSSKPSFQIFCSYLRQQQAPLGTASPFRFKVSLYEPNCHPPESIPVTG